MEGIEFSRWLLEGRPRQGKNMLPDELNWLCYFAGSSKSHCENSISFMFWESLHQVDMKQIVKSSKHFFGYFNTLKTHSACIALASNEMILLSTHSFCCTIWLVCMYSNTHFSVFCNFKWPKNCCLFLRKLGQNSTLFCCKDTLTIVKLNLVTFISWSKIFSLI